jgi:glycosyltransferase A (GT-A) superfamily protein (DUF2064 family)
VKRLALFTRLPVPGQVKTRLSPALPPALAAGLYEALFADTLDEVRACGAEERTLWWPGDPPPGPAPAGFEARRQAGTEAGERLARVAGELMRGRSDRVVMVTSGVPALRAALLDEAFALRASADLVLGPATDGGCWLVGLAREVPARFAGLAHGVPEAFERTRADAVRAGLDVRTVAMLDGLETPHELVRLLAGEATEHTRVFGPHTRAFLVQSGMLPE